MAAKIQMKRIDSDVLAVLETGIVQGNVYELQGQLDRPMYEKTNKALEGLGLKWNKKLKGHCCSDGDDVAERIEDAIQTRSYEKPNRLEFFETPQEVIMRMLLLADLERGTSVLEPSAGNGAIARAVAERVGRDSVVCVEIDKKRVDGLRRDGFTVAASDFLTLTVASIYARVLMNPPFRHQADIDHVLRAWQWLRPSGRLVAVMSAGTVTRTTQKARAFQRLLDEFGYYEDLPDGTFKESGTMVSTILVVLDKPAA